MRIIVLHSLLGISVVAALMLGISCLRLLYIIASSHPEETVYYRPPFFGSLCAFIVALWPIALYAAVFAASRDIAWTRFGRVVFFVQAVYAIIVITQWVYVYRHSTATPNKTGAGNGSMAICRISNVLRSPSPDPKR